MDIAASMGLVCGRRPRRARGSARQVGYWRHTMTQTSPVEQLTSNSVVLEDSIEVPAPVNDVYRHWSDLPRFPEFMANVEEVQPRGGNRYHWVARLFGVKQEWDAEVTEYDPLRR